MIKNILFSLAHITFGFLASVSVLISPVLTVVNFLIFFVYEMDQQWTISDEAYQELREYGFGFGLGVVVMLITLLSKIYIGG
jgi:hypothetical protein